MYSYVTAFFIQILVGEEILCNKFAEITFADNSTSTLLLKQNVFNITLDCKLQMSYAVFLFYMP